LYEDEEANAAKTYEGSSRTTSPHDCEAFPNHFDYQCTSNLIVVCTKPCFNAKIQPGLLAKALLLITRVCRLIGSSARISPESGAVPKEFGVVWKSSEQF
jgi:hypothetical protein